jgi:hypothetical protein
VTILCADRLRLLPGKAPEAPWHPFILSAMTDDPAELPIREYIARGAAEGALAAARRLTEAIGVSLNDVLWALQDIDPTAKTASASLVIGVTMTAQANVVVHGPTGVISVSAPAGEAGTTVEDLQAVRPAEVDRLSRSRFTLATLSLRNRLLAAVVLITAVYPFLPPEVQKYLLEEVGLAAAIAQIFSLLKF